MYTVRCERGRGLHAHSGVQVDCETCCGQAPDCTTLFAHASHRPSVSIAAIPVWVLRLRVRHAGERNI